MFSSVASTKLMNFLYLCRAIFDAYFVQGGSLPFFSNRIEQQNEYSLNRI
ncbi:RAxF-45 family protein [Bacillus sp. HMF5848]